MDFENEIDCILSTLENDFGLELNVVQSETEISLFEKWIDRTVFRSSTKEDFYIKLNAYAAGVYRGFSVATEKVLSALAPR